MWKKGILVFFLLAACIGMNHDVYASAELPSIEVYDITKSEVVQRIQNTVEIQKETQLCLEAITNILNPLGHAPKEGKMIRIPLDPPIMVQSHVLTTLAHEVFLIVIPETKPFFVLINEERKPFLVEFNRDAKGLLNLLKQ